MTNRIPAWLLAALLAAAIAGSTKTIRSAEPMETQAADKAPDHSGAAPKRPEKEGEKEKEPPPVVTDHEITLGGKTFKYRVTAGYFYLPEDPQRAGDGDDGRAPPHPAPEAKPEADQPKAKIFYVSYIRQGVDDLSRRPLTFAFNGGPGSASIWLHMGALGPRQPHLTDRGEAPPPPYQLEDNGNSWIDDTDLVFIDPMSTGYSRPTAGTSANEFYGYQPDLSSVANFIRLYTSRSARWSSPKFLCGESYGTTRAAGLSGYLQDRYGLYLNGVILVSSVLNFQTLSFAPGNDAPYPLFLPTYTATAWYHRRLAAEIESRPLATILGESEAFASREYPQALMQGDALAADEKSRTAAKLARLTGLPAARLEQLNLRVPASLFFTALLSDQNREIGRYDSRFQGIRLHPGTDLDDFDPSYEAVSPTFVSVFNDYIRRELKFESDLPYEALTRVRPWPLAPAGYLDVAETLKQAMSRNPYLKVWICCGYYDLATPYFAAKTTVAQMMLDPAVRPNLSMTYYDAGHMIYINRPSQTQFKRDFETFLHSAILPASQVVPAAAP